MVILLILFNIWKFFYAQYRYYIHDWYCLNEYLFSTLIVYLMYFVFIFHYLKHNHYEKYLIHKWELLEYNFSHLCFYYFGGIGIINWVKVANEPPFPIYWYVFFYTFAICWVYFGCDGSDRYTGWNMGYRIDVFFEETGLPLHWWYVREDYNQRLWHFVMILFRPWHIRFMIVFIHIVVPIAMFMYPLTKMINRIHVPIHNSLFFWNTRRFTIDEIQAQWEQDRIHNYVYWERTRFGGWLIIL